MAFQQGLADLKADVTTFKGQFDQLKSQFDLTQDQVDSIATAGLWPNILGAAIIPGFVNDRFGPRVTIAGAASFTSAGLLLFWLTMTGHIPVFCGSVQQQLMLFEGLRSWGNQWPTAAILPVSMKNFPAWREPTLSVLVVALLKFIASIGGGLSVQLYLAFLAPDETSFILFLAVCIFFMYMLAVPVLVFFPDPPRGDDPLIERRRFIPAFVIAIAMIAGIIANAYLSVDLPRAARFGFAAALMVGFSLIGTSLMGDWTAGCYKGKGRDASQGAPLLGGGGNDGPQLPEALYGQLRLGQSMRTIDCWLMTFCTLAICASTGVVQVNVAQIVQSLGHSGSTPFMVTLYSVGTAIGRLAGTAAVELLRLADMERSLSFALTCLAALLGQLLLATSVWGAMLGGVVLSGLANGSVWTIIPIIMADLFGLENLGSNYKVTCIGEAVGVLAVSRGLAAHLYQQAISQGHGAAPSRGGSGSSADGLSALMVGDGDQNGGGGGRQNTCIGAVCFRQTFLLCAGLCFVATGAGLWLSKRTAQMSRLLKGGRTH